MPSTLSPLRPATTLPARLSEVKPFRVTAIVRPIGTNQPARPVSLTIWALGLSMATLLAHRQIADLNLLPLGGVSVSQA